MFGTRTLTQKRDPEFGPGVPTSALAEREPRVRILIFILSSLGAFAVWPREFHGEHKITIYGSLIDNDILLHIGRENYFAPYGCEIKIPRIRIKSGIQMMNAGARVRARYVM